MQYKMSEVVETYANRKIEQVRKLEAKMGFKGAQVES